MLKLRRSLPDYVEVALGGGATARVRSATAVDVDRATGFVQTMMASATALGTEGFRLLALALGEDPDALELTDEIKGEGSFRLSLAKLAVLCTESWSGVCDNDGEPLTVTLENMMLLQMDAGIRAAYSAVVNARIHQQVAEKNGLAASPNGAAAADGATAPPAETAASLAPSATAAAPEHSAPRSSTLP